MKLKLTLVFVLSITFTASAQLSINGLAPQSSHVTIQRLAGDSAWLAYKYDEVGRLNSAGTYKDSMLTIPQGKFQYYTYKEAVMTTKMDASNHPYNAILIPARVSLTTGYFSNGKRVGRWCYYIDDKMLSKIETYENDKLNGLNKTYDGTVKPFVVGQYSDNVREGEWCVLNTHGDTVEIDNYEKGKVISRIDQSAKKGVYYEIEGAKPNYNFIQLLNESLKPDLKIQRTDKNMRYDFTLTTEGKLLYNEDPFIDSDRLDVTIINAITALPPWIPGSHNHTTEQVSVNIALHVTVNKKGEITTELGQISDEAKAAVRRFNAMQTSGAIVYFTK